MSSLIALIGKFWPFRILLEKKSSLLTLDSTSFPECVSKEVYVWSWRRFKTVKYVVHYEQGKFVVKSLD